jgi:hypothetical protein
LPSLAFVRFWVAYPSALDITLATLRRGGSGLPSTRLSLLAIIFEKISWES